MVDHLPSARLAGCVAGLLRQPHRLLSRISRPLEVLEELQLDVRNNDERARFATKIPDLLEQPDALVRGLHGLCRSGRRRVALRHGVQRGSHQPDIFDLPRQRQCLLRRLQGLVRAILEGLLCRPPLLLLLHDQHRLGSGVVHQGRHLLDPAVAEFPVQSQGALASFQGDVVLLELHVDVTDDAIRGGLACQVPALGGHRLRLLRCAGGASEISGGQLGGAELQEGSGLALGVLRILEELPGLDGASGSAFRVALAEKDLGAQLQSRRLLGQVVQVFEDAHGVLHDAERLVEEAQAASDAAGGSQGCGPAAIVAGILVRVRRLGGRSCRLGQVALPRLHHAHQLEGGTFASLIAGVLESLEAIGRGLECLLHVFGLHVCFHERLEEGALARRREDEDLG
mmetsp:Transcript_92971/g.259852  ORF Transcript_92971/g.259852 Transcript_92971/m.259852 type:complete len:399 (+) Transcript_92971:606-1802(+)